MPKKKAEMPSENERLDRIQKNYAKLPKKQQTNIKRSERGKKILKHASGKAGMVAGNPARPQDRVKRS